MNRQDRAEILAAGNLLPGEDLGQIRGRISARFWPPEFLLPCENLAGIPAGSKNPGGQTLAGIPERLPPSSRRDPAKIPVLVRERAFWLAQHGQFVWMIGLIILILQRNKNCFLFQTVDVYLLILNQFESDADVMPKDIVPIDVLTMFQSTTELNHENLVDFVSELFPSLGSSIFHSYLNFCASKKEESLQHRLIKSLRLVHWTKLFWIGVLWQKRKASKAMQVIFWLS